jgi:aminocarboxymuconate-semialdehyde decarboxylase
MSNHTAAATIDAHAHLVPGTLVELLRAGEHGIDPIRVESGEDGTERWIMGTDKAGRPFEIRRYPEILSDVSERLKWMDGLGIDIQYVSLWGELHAYALEPEECARWCRLVNEHLLAATAGEERLRPWGAVPLGSPELAAAEVEWAAAAGFEGVMGGLHPGPAPLDDPAYSVLWETAARTGMVVYLHPDYPYWNEKLGGEILAGSLGRLTDTATTLARLIVSGLFHAHPELKVIGAHGGGGLPYYWGRLRHSMGLESSEYLSEGLPPGLYYDSITHDPAALGFLIDQAGADHLLLGSDYPFPLRDPRPVETVVAGVADREESVLPAVLGANLSRLLASRT